MTFLWNDLEKIFINFQRNDEYIFVVVIVIFGLLLVMTIVGVNLNKKVKHNIDKIVTVETDGSQTNYDVQNLNGEKRKKLVMNNLSNLSNSSNSSNSSN
jgi:hypothetical protein